MSHLVKWLFRPAILIIVSVALLGVAAIVIIRTGGKPQPAVVRSGEQEIAFLYPATSTVWERFTSAVRSSVGRLESQYPGLRCLQEAPGKSSALPHIALEWPASAGQESPGRLVFRWYKLSSEWQPRTWIEALLARRPPPLAVIGGNNSFWARELAIELNRAAAGLPAARRPLLLLTTATADRVAPVEPNGDEGLVDLHSLYPDRTFRFCFTNRQMATAVTRFLWSQPELRPDSDPAVLVQWNDDSYSQDLFAGSIRVLNARARDSSLEQWAWVSGCIGLGVPPPVLAGWSTSAFRHEEAVQLRIDSSVGSFAAPNPYEAKAVRTLLERMEALGGSAPRRPLLIVTGQSGPSRRLLRDLARSAPDTARRFVVAMGDAVSFNTIYRDRLVTWPIQDLPFDLVFFCHRNPIDEQAGFAPLPGANRPRTRRSTDGLSDRSRAMTSASGTEDLLLHGDIVEALALAYRGTGQPVRDAAELARRLAEVHKEGHSLGLSPVGVPLFHPDGQRQGGTGEHVVHLRPRFLGDRVLPEAVIQVWRRGDRLSGEVWQRVGQPLTVSYDEYKVHGDRSHGSD